MITAEINRQELDKLMKRIERLAAIDTTKRKEIRNEARKIARNNYIAALKVSIQDYPRTIVVVRDGTRIVIPPGTLRRSLGTWTPKDAKARIAAGPRQVNSAKCQTTVMAGSRTSLNLVISLTNSAANIALLTREYFKMQCSRQVARCAVK